MDLNDNKQNILRLTELLLNLIHHEKQLSEHCQSFKDVDSSLDQILEEIETIFVKSSFVNNKLIELCESLKNILVENRPKNLDEEFTVSKLVVAFTRVLVGIHMSLETYDILTEDNPESILSVKHESTIRLSLGLTIKHGFGPLIQSLFADGEKLLPISSATLSTTGPKSTSVAFAKILYVILLDFALKCSSPSNLRIQGDIFKDCFAVLIACRVHYMRDANQKFFEDVHQRLEGFCSDRSNKEMVLRDLIFLSRCKPIPAIFARINRFLKQTFTEPNGIEILVRAILDSDPASETATSITTRIVSIATIVVFLPLKEKQEYLTNLAQQSVQLLQIDESKIKTEDFKHASSIFWRTAAQVLSQIHEISPEIIDTVLFSTLNDVFSGKWSLTVPSIDCAIEIIHRIVMSAVHFPIEALCGYFQSLLFIRFKLENYRSSPIRTVLDQLLVHLLENIPESVYLLDETISVPLDSWLDRFEVFTDTESLQARVRYAQGDQNREELVNKIETYQSFCDLLMQFLKKMNLNFAYDLFFLLLEKIIGDDKTLLNLLILSSLGEFILEQNENEHSDENEEKELMTSAKRIRFLSNTFERIVSKLFDTEKTPKTEVDQLRLDDSEEDDQDQFGLYCETLKICMGILVIIVEKLEQIPMPKKNRKCTATKSSQSPENALESVENIQRELQICKSSLRKLLSNPRSSEVLQPLERIQAEDVLERLEKILVVGDDESKNVNMSALNKALKNIREPFMPIRAHGLIVVKQLTLARDPAVSERFQIILESIQLLLVDSESYLYLAAVNALGALAIIHTDRVLPILLDELVGLGENRKIRDIKDRHKIGEALMQLAKSIGDFAYHYSGQFVNKLLVGIKNQDATIRISCLVCLGKFCRAFKYGLSSNIVELVLMGESMLTSDPCMEVRRAAADFFRQLLEGLDSTNVWLVQEHIKTIKDAILKASATTLDDVLQSHCCLVYEQLSRIAQELMQTDFKAQHGFRQIL